MDRIDYLETTMLRIDSIIKNITLNFGTVNTIPF